MNRIDTLDVLVVYSATVALSASVTDSHSKHPFLLSSKQALYNRSYAYFLDACRKQGVTAGFTSSDDIVGPGMCKQYWTANSGDWTKVTKRARSLQVFDKLSPSSLQRAEERSLLLSHDSVVPFNDPELFSIFFDKQRTYKKFRKFAIPTVSLSSSTPSSIETALKKLSIARSQHPHATDFTTAVVLKDRFGAGGNLVYKITNVTVEKIKHEMDKNKDTKFILQPFLSFDSGFSYQENNTSTDIRLIFQHNTLLQSYVRMAKPNDFRCNEHQGGQLLYISENEVPKQILQTAKKIVASINKPRSLFALDFVVSNSGNVYFIEGNIGPGIDWDSKKKNSEKMSKQLIRSIVTEMANRIKLQQSL